MDLYIHIGYPNTASTLFEREFYSKHSEINYLGAVSQKYQKELNLVQNNKNNDILLYILYYIFHTSRDQFNKSLTNLHSKISGIQFDQNKTNLISYTGFLNPGRQSYEYLLRDAMNAKITDNEIIHRNKNLFNDTAELFYRLKKLFNTFDEKINLKIFYTIRNQCEFLKSYYTHFDTAIHYLYKKNIKFKDIIKRLNKNVINDDITSKIMTYFYYNKINNELLSLFGEKNINVLVYEEFVENSKLFIKNFSNYLMIHENESFNLMKEKTTNKVWRYNDGSFHKDTKFILLFKKSIIFKILRKLFHKNTKLLIHKFLAKEIIGYNDKEKKIIKKYFFEENTKLSKKLNIDLKMFGYF